MILKNLPLVTRQPLMIMLTIMRWFQGTRRGVTLLEHLWLHPMGWPRWGSHGRTKLNQHSHNSELGSQEHEWMRRMKHRMLMMISHMKVKLMTKLLIMNTNMRLDMITTMDIVAWQSTSFLSMLMVNPGVIRVETQPSPATLNSHHWISSLQPSS